LQEALKEVEKNPPPKLDDPVNEESSKEGPKEKKKNYLLKSIKRIP
jgi:hypothetical protein